MSSPDPTVSTVAAIIVAAGPGTRLGTSLPKAFVELAGLPLVVRSLRALLRAPSIDAVVVVVPPDGIERARALLERHGPWRCQVAVAAGGAARQDSVRNGLAALGATQLIAIHDAARPFVSAEVIEATIAAAEHYGAAIAATPATDTVKQVHADGWIEATPARERMWLAQTPQVFRADLIRTAHSRGATSSNAATDDAALVERLGIRVHVVAANPENRKITTPEDLRWAEWFLANSPEPR